MRAILIATGASSNLGSLAEVLTSPMLPLVDRPFLQHIVESLAARGFTEFDFIVSYLAHEIEEYFGGGQRWGVTIRYHVARDANYPYRLLRTMSPRVDDDRVMLGHADRFPPLGSLIPPQPGGGITLYCEHEHLPYNDHSKWMGWGWINQGDIEGLTNDLDKETFTDYLIARAGQQGLVVGQGELSIRDFASLLASHRNALTSRDSGLLFGALEVEPGIWLSRNVVIHPTARLTAPVYLCDDCSIGEGAEVGPSTVVGTGCILDRRCSIVGSILFPSSYVGEGLELRDVIVVRNHLIDVRLGVELSIDDELLLASASSRAIGARFGKLLARGSAIVTLLFTWPILLITAFVLAMTRSERALRSTEVVRLPAPSHIARWKTYRQWRFDVVSKVAQGGEACGGIRHLLFSFLPGLINVARGELRFVGVPPLSTTAIRDLPEDWRTLYLRSKAGLITEASLLPPGSHHPDDYRVSHAYYAVAGGTFHDFRLVLVYLKQTIFGWTQVKIKVRQVSTRIRQEESVQVMPH